MNAPRATGNSVGLIMDAKATIKLLEPAAIAQKPAVDRREYMRDFMRKKRAEAKA